MGELFGGSYCDTLLALKAGFRRRGIRPRRFFLLDGCRSGIFCGSEYLAGQQAGYTPGDLFGSGNESNIMEAPRPGLAEVFSVIVEPVPIF